MWVKRGGPERRSEKRTKLTGLLGWTTVGHSCDVVEERSERSTPPTMRRRRQRRGGGGTVGGGGEGDLVPEGDLRRRHQRWPGIYLRLH